MSDRTHLKARLIAALQRRADRVTVDQEQPRPVPASALARWLGICPHGSRESRRRRVRELIAELRRDGQMIAESNAGYALVLTAAQLAQLQEFRRRSGVRHLARARQAGLTPTADDLHGQLGLFAGLTPRAPRARRASRPSQNPSSGSAATA